jgi:hypothetical protein
MRGALTMYVSSGWRCEAWAWKGVGWAKPPPNNFFWPLGRNCLKTGERRGSTPFVHAFLLMPLPKVHPLGKCRVPGRGGFACFGLSPPPGQRCDLFYFALDSPRCWTGPAAVGLSFQVRLPWV